MSPILNLFDTEGFMPHGTSILWRTDLLLLHAASDSLTALAYYTIPLALLYFAYRRGDLEFRWMFVLFGIFIAASGTTHLMAIWTLWNPDHGVAGAVKAATAIASVGTAVMLWRIMPEALAIPSKTQLADANRALEQQIADRREAEATVRRLNATLEERVNERMAELERVNRELQAEIARREHAEERFRLAVEASPSGVVMVDSEGRIVLVNGQTEQLFGYSREEILNQPIEILVPEPVRANHGDHRAGFLRYPVTRPMGKGRDLSARRKDGSEFPVEIGLNPIETAEGTFVLGAVVDITERKRHEAQLKLVMDELNHRVKNTLTIVLAIVSQTLRHSQSLEGFREAITRRLQSLAEAHSLLSRSNWGAASLRELIAAALAPYRSAEHEVAVEGPSLSLRPSAALAMSMVLHELANNAATHGALARPSGRIRIDWRLSDDGQRLAVRWAEQPGRPLGEPRKRGFGLRLIEYTLRHEFEGDVETAYEPKGFVCEMTLPWENAAAPASTAA